MHSLLSSPRNALLTGVGLAALLFVAAIVFLGGTGVGMVSTLLRAIHVLAAMIWVGMIWFVNFVQHRAVQEADDAGRALLFSAVVPRVAHAFRHGSHLTIVSGVLLMIPSGYLLSSWVYGSAVHTSPVRAAIFGLAVLGALVMWGLVHMAIWPALGIVLGSTPADADAKAAARRRVALYARINLVLALPVVLGMIVVAHLY